MRRFQQNSCHQEVEGSINYLRLYLTLPAVSATSECTFFCPPSTQELPKKHHEAGSSEQVPNYSLSQIDYGHTVDTFEIAKRFCTWPRFKREACGISEIAYCVEEKTKPIRHEVTKL